MRALRTLMALWVGLATASVAEEGALLYERGRAQYVSARSGSVWSAKKEAYLRASADLQQFLRRFPDHPKLPDALFNLGSIYQEIALNERDRVSAERALYHFRALLEKTPRDRLADDALFRIAQVCAGILNDPDCHRASLERIRAEYPSGDMIAQVGADRSLGAAASPALTELLGVEVEEPGEGFRVRLKLSRPAQYLAKPISADPSGSPPPRFFVDLAQSRPAEGVTNRSFRDSPLRQLRIARYTETTTRVVLDLGAGVTPAEVVAVPSEEGIEIRYRTERPVEAPVVAVTTATPAPTSPPPEAEKVSEPAEVPKDAAIHRIILDPGHGGEDEGARGKKGTKEKDVVLSIARRLRDRLSRQENFQVFLTREDDRFLPLLERTQIANRMSGDLFVSIHANASPKRSARGVSTYFLDNADDEESLRVATRENGDLDPLLATQGKEKPEEYYLEVMKASLIKNFHTVQSTDLARAVQHELHRELTEQFREVHDLGVRSARFYVLTGANMPAILVETSFISNPDEEKRLRDRKYQEKIGEAIEEGILRFFRERRDHASVYRP